MLCVRAQAVGGERPALTEPLPEYAALITTLILERPTCVDCVATKVDMTAQSVLAYLERMSRTVNVQRLSNERCRACGTIGAMVSIGRE